jgi:hypothetical protein
MILFRAEVRIAVRYVCHFVILPVIFMDIPLGYRMTMLVRGLIAQGIAELPDSDNTHHDGGCA